MVSGVPVPGDRRATTFGCRLQWRAACVYMTHAPQWPHKALTGGPPMHIVPPLGWIMALGFRSLTGERLTRGIEPNLPPWRGHLVETIGRGVKSSAVILTYLSPALVLFFVCGAGNLGTLVDHRREIGLAV